ncbi:AAA family ATPase [Sporosarcina sp. FA9]|uniref:AAA family ATPase n=1 Tax=Sporosarcina sp. FA9 TaxID=3413030 RepID=UPI003F65F62C
MIKKFIAIKGVGNYENFNASEMIGNVMLEKVNLIYANNGSGKTTLTAILKSLKNGNGKIITDRKTIGYEDEQRVEILADEKHDFKNGVWNKNLPNIEIFDTFFINNNVFSGFDNSLSHNKQLHRFVLGEKGVDIAKNISFIKERIIELRKGNNELKREISKNTKKHDFKSYMSLEIDADIESKIKKKEIEIEITKKQDEIKRMDVFRQLPEINIPLDFADCKSVLGMTVEDIDQKYIETVQVHIQSLETEEGDNNPEEWLKEGYQLYNHDRKECPFCRQSVSTVESLITSYRHFFNAEYNELTEKSLKQISVLKGYNIMLEIEKVNSVNLENVRLLSFWSPLIQTDIKLNLDISIDMEGLYNYVCDDFDRKSKNPINKIATDNIDKLEEELNLTNQIIQAVNVQLIVANNEVDKLKKQVRDLELLGGEHETLLEVENRYKNPMKQMCIEYKDIESYIERTNDLNVQLQKELKEYSEEVFKKYGDGINNYLRQFSTPYEMEQIKSSIVGTSKDPSISYVLKLKGEEVTFNKSKNKIRAEKALSDGDRSTLALSFFMAKLEIDNNIGEKIIVFDDPLSSFDSDRRKKTVNKVIEMGKKAKQTFILSHNKNFIIEIYKKIAPKMMSIKINGGLDVLNRQDIDRLIDHPYFTSIQEIEDFCDEPNYSIPISYLQGHIRLVLEDSLKFRYRRYLRNEYQGSDGKKIGPLSNKEGLGSMINLLEVSDCKFKEDKEEVIKELRELNEFSIAPHHGSIETAHSEQDLTGRELTTFLRETIDMVYLKL